MRKVSALFPCLLLSIAACGDSAEVGGTAQDASTPTADAGSTDGGTVVDSAVAPGIDGGTPQPDSGIGGGTDDAGQDAGPPPARKIKTVFVVVMENHNWDSITGGNAPYIKSLLPQSSYCDNYFDNPKSIHPSEPNYIWMEAGDNLGITNDDDPSASHSLKQTDHLVSQLTAKGVTWKSYQEDLPDGQCGTKSTGKYASKHNPMVFFTDVSGDPPSNTNATCIQHVRPYKELAADLAANKVAQYNFITPNQCHDMHDVFGCAHLDQVQNGDEWLAAEVPKILASQAFKDDGVLFITWDESTSGEHPIGMIALSSLAKGGGYVSKTKYFHSSLLRTVEEIFGVPLLRDAQNQPSLADLFTTYP